MADILVIIIKTKDKGRYFLLMKKKKIVIGAIVTSVIGAGALAVTAATKFYQKKKQEIDETEEFVIDVTPARPGFSTKGSVSRASRPLPVSVAKRQKDHETYSVRDEVLKRLNKD